MGNNKAFASYVVLVVGGAGALLAALFVAGIATVPPLSKFLIDVALGLGIRAAYKQVGGWDWNEWKWSFSGDTEETVAAVLPLPVAAEEVFAKAA